MKPEHQIVEWITERGEKKSETEIYFHLLKRTHTCLTQQIKFTNFRVLHHKRGKPFDLHVLRDYWGTNKMMHCSSLLRYKLIYKGNMYSKEKFYTELTLFSIEEKR